MSWRSTWYCCWVQRMHLYTQFAMKVTGWHNIQQYSWYQTCVLNALHMCYILVLPSLALLLKPEDWQQLSHSTSFSVVGYLEECKSSTTTLSCQFQLIFKVGDSRLVSWSAYLVYCDLTCCEKNLAGFAHCTEWCRFGLRRLLSLSIGQIDYANGDWWGEGRLSSLRRL